MSRVYSDRDLLELFRMLLRQQIDDERIYNITELWGLLGHVEEALESSDELAVLRAINANLMGDDENVPRYTTRRLKQEIARAVDAIRNGEMSDGPRADAIDIRNWSEGKE